MRKSDHEIRKALIRDMDPRSRYTRTLALSPEETVQQRELHERVIYLCEVQKLTHKQAGAQVGYSEMSVCRILQAHKTLVGTYVDRGAVREAILRSTQKSYRAIAEEVGTTRQYVKEVKWRARGDQ